MDAPNQPRDAWAKAWAVQDAQTIRRFVEFLRDNTDTFDPVIVRMALDSGDSIKPDDAMIEQWIEAFAGNPDGPANTPDAGLIGHLERVDREWATPVYAKVTTGQQTHTRALSTLSADERAAITGVEVHVDIAQAKLAT